MRSDRLTSGRSDQITPLDKNRSLTESAYDQTLSYAFPNVDSVRIELGTLRIGPEEYSQVFCSFLKIVQFARYVYIVYIDMVWCKSGVAVTSRISRNPRSGLGFELGILRMEVSSPNHLPCFYLQ